MNKIFFKRNYKFLNIKFWIFEKNFRNVKLLFNSNFLELFVILVVHYRITDHTGKITEKWSLMRAYLVQNAWYCVMKIWCIALFYCKIQYISKNSSTSIPPPLYSLIHMKLKHWLALGILLFSKWLLLFYLLQAS